MRKDLRYAYILLSCVLIIASGCQGQVRTVPHEISFKGLRIVVWDAGQPLFLDKNPWENDMMECVKEFAEKYQVSVEVRFASREDIRKAIAGETEALPDLVYSTEWSVLHSNLVPLGEVLDFSEILDSARTFWTDKGGEILGIPAYIHWFSTASKQKGAVGGKAGYWPESPAFFAPILSEGLTEVDVLEYLRWVRETYGPPDPDPLTLWEDGEASVLFPVNPYLLRWLEESGGGAFPSMLPAPSGARVFYTAPGYVVLSGADPKRTCCALLGKALAEKLGLWAAQTFGGIPACSKDVSAFHLFSSLPYEDRVFLLGAVEDAAVTAPDEGEELLRLKIQEACGEDIFRYLQGLLSEEELIGSIQRQLGGHTRGDP